VTAFGEGGAGGFGDGVSADYFGTAEGGVVGGDGGVVFGCGW